MTDITEDMVERAARAWVEVRSDPNVHPAGLHHWMRAALTAALSEDDTEWEYGTKWDDIDNPVPSESRGAAEMMLWRHPEPAGKIMRRTPTVPAGPWEPVPENTGISPNASSAPGISPDRKEGDRDG